MRSPLLVALAVALAATFWLQQGEDPDAIEVVERRPPVRSAAVGDPRRALTGRRDPTSAEAPSANQAGDWLADRVQAWQARRSEVEALPVARAMTSAAPSAWSAVLPPQPPAPSRTQGTADAEPVAPPFPHQWVGRFDDEASAGSKPLRRAVISGPVSTWVAREGDVIEGQWRVDQIQGRLMKLTYLPLQQSQTVAMK